LVRASLLGIINPNIGKLAFSWKTCSASWASYNTFTFAPGYSDGNFTSGAFEIAVNLSHFELLIFVAENIHHAILYC
jgi:hypothetical protein